MRFLIILPASSYLLRQSMEEYLCCTVSLFLSLMVRFSQILQQIYANAHLLACGCRYEWRQPVRSDGPDDVLTAINMAKKH